nr:NAD-dependent epimerase/dehydratase family protein [Chloroflexota bacterium]
MTGPRERGRVLVTGGAGFIGSTLVDALLARGRPVTIFDDLSSAEIDRASTLTGAAEAAQPIDGDPRLRFVRGDVRDVAALESAMAGHELVVHLAAHTDIARGRTDPWRDFQVNVAGTWNVLEAMRRLGVSRLMFASSGTVYGYPTSVPTTESYGPLLPESPYAAAKLAGEALIAGSSALHGWRALAFRFGNTVGEHSDHGLVHDLVVKLLRDPGCLELLGDGRQAKPYVAVDDVVAAMLLAESVAPAATLTVLNVGTSGTLTVARVAELVIDALGLDDTAVERVYLDGAARGG